MRALGNLDAGNFATPKAGTTIIAFRKLNCAVGREKRGRSDSIQRWQSPLARHVKVHSGDTIGQRYGGALVVCPYFYWLAQAVRLGDDAVDGQSGRCGWPTVGGVHCFHDY